VPWRLRRLHQNALRLLNAQEAPEAILEGEVDDE
jgi:hypothetical protein